MFLEIYLVGLYLASACPQLWAEGTGKKVGQTTRARCIFQLLQLLHKFQNLTMFSPTTR